MKDRIVDLKDTKFSIEVEALRLPDDVIEAAVRKPAEAQQPERG